jgi:hypothetical protein
MEVTTLKDHAQTPSRFADRLFVAERGIRYGRKPRRSTARLDRRSPWGKAKTDQGWRGRYRQKSLKRSGASSV